MRKYTYPKKLRSQVCQWQASIDRLKENLKRAGVDTRRQLEHQIQDLQAKQRAARRKLERLDRVGGPMGKSSRSVNSTLHGIRHVVQKFVSGFK